MWLSSSPLPALESASAEGMAEPVWHSSRGVSSVRRDGVLELHRRFFVENRGMDGINELIEARAKEGLKKDQEHMREHRAKLEKLEAEMEDKLKNALLHGSTSIWTDEERAKLRARNSKEAQDKMAKEMHALERSFRQDSGAMTERVRSRPPLNVRSKAEMAGLFVHNAEAAKQLEQRIKELGSSYREERNAMTARLESSKRSTSRWSEEKQAQMAEIRADCLRLRQEQDAQQKSASEAWQVHKKAMLEKVKDLPSLSFRTPREKKELNQVRADPEETKERLLEEMRQRERTAREQKAAMLQKIQQTPRRTFWTPEEKELLEARKHLDI